MKLRVLGPYGGELPGCFLSGFLLDESVLIDAGTISLVLDQKEQLKIEHVLISHPHLDHIAALPHMAVNVFANDVVTVQTAEIGVMRQMLSQLPPE